MTDLTPVTAPDDLALVALSPHDMASAQTDLIDWFDRKIKALAIDRSDFLDNARIAAEHGWASKNLEAKAQRVQREIAYYEKLKAASQAGYLIVPNFEAEIMAVRIKRRRPPQDEYDYRRDVPTTPADRLPIGEGRYVTSGVMTKSVERFAPDREHPGQDKRVTRYIATRFIEDIDFPVMAVKPSVMSATARAMALRVFDQIGVVTGRKKDPVVIGEIVHPKATHWDRRRVTFFIAWWLNTRDL